MLISYLWNWFNFDLGGVYQLSVAAVTNCHRFRSFETTEIKYFSFSESEVQVESTESSAQGPTKPKSGCGPAWALLWRLRGRCHFRLIWRVGRIQFLVAIRLKSPFPWQVPPSSASSPQCLLEPSQASNLYLLLLARERARLLLLRDHVIRLDLPPIIQYNFPILKPAGW